MAPSHNNRQPKRSLQKKRAASLISYALLVGLVSAVALSAITESGDSTTELFDTVAGKLENSSAGATASGSASASPSASASASQPPCSNEADSVFGVGTGYAGAGSFTVAFPQGCTQAQVSMWGGGGNNLIVETGCDSIGSGSPQLRDGGAGGFTTGTITLPPERETPTGRVLAVEVQDKNQSADFGFMYGGGAAVIRWNDQPATAELLVAGGGGAAVSHGGGAGGGTVGQAGVGGGSRRSCFTSESSTTGGGGASQIAGGTGGGCDIVYGNHKCPGNVGSRQTGATTQAGVPNQGGVGGHGYYGGGQGAASAFNGSGGGGGSGYVDSSVTGSTHGGNLASPGASGGSETDRTDPGLGNPQAGEPEQAGKVIIRWLP